MTARAEGAVPPAMESGGLLLPRRGCVALQSFHIRYLKDTTKAFLLLGEDMRKELLPKYQRLRDWMRIALRGDPKAVLSLFAQPNIGTAIRCYLDRFNSQKFLLRIEDRFEQALAELLLEMARLRLLPQGHSIEWLRDVEGLQIRPWRIILHPPEGSVALRFSPGVIESAAQGGRWSPLFLDREILGNESRSMSGFRWEASSYPAGAASELALKDSNPISMLEEHPEKSGNAWSLGERSMEEWRASLDQSFALVEKHIPDLAEEMALVLKEIVPVGYHPQKHLSASYREAVGVIYLTLHPNVLTMTEALIHEFQHNKLNLAGYQGAMLENAFTPLYTSPVRPDPRPLWGILLAVHAFLPVAAFYRAMRKTRHPLSQSPDFDKRLSEIDLKNEEGMRVLRAHGRWTPFGRKLWEELEALNALHGDERRQAGLSVQSTLSHES